MDHAKLLINVHVNGRLGEVQRLLASLRAHPSLWRCPILLVNNTHDEAARRAISVAAAVADLPALREVDPSSWICLREFALRRVDGDREVAVCLERLELGRPGWVIDEARNVGMIAAALLHPECTHVLNFDSDIVVPPDLELALDPGLELSSLQITGCPDLSRLEWIDIYCRAAAALVGRELPETTWYPTRLARSLEPRNLARMVEMYTDLLRQPVVERCSIGPFLRREEFHGACYVIATNRLGVSPVPKWSDNDWFLFRAVRPSDRTVEFLAESVEHAASQKHVIDDDALESEELGKLINRCYELGGVSSVRRAVRDRLEVIHGVAGLVGAVARSWPFAAPATAAQELHDALQRLAERVSEISAAGVLAEIRSFESLREVWGATVARLQRCDDGVRPHALVLPAVGEAVAHDTGGLL